MFPFIVLLGAGSKTTDPTSTKICKFLGDISFPIYITHYPLIYLQMGFAITHADAPTWMHVANSAGVFFFAIILAYGILKIYDEPTRKWLTEHWLKGEQRLPLWTKVTGSVAAVLALFIGLKHEEPVKEKKERPLPPPNGGVQQAPEATLPSEALDSASAE